MFKNFQSSCFKNAMVFVIFSHISIQNSSACTDDIWQKPSDASIAIYTKDPEAATPLSYPPSEDRDFNTNVWNLSMDGIPAGFHLLEPKKELKKLEKKVDSLALFYFSTAKKLGALPKLCRIEYWEPKPDYEKQNPLNEYAKKNSKDSLISALHQKLELQTKKSSDVPTDLSL